MTKKIKLKTNRYSGAGNTFLIGTMPEGKKISKGLIKKICQKKNKTDGVLFLTPISSRRDCFKWRFFNSDGSSAEMCGNALRCAGKYCYEELGAKNKMEFRTPSGKVFCFKKGKSFFAIMPQIKKEKQLQNPQGFFVDTGVPHFVISIEAKGFKEIFKKQTKRAQELRHNKKLFPKGSNITFLFEKRKKHYAVTFERGVEAFTKACGTGAVAVARFLSLKNKRKKYRIKMPGGLLEVFLGKQVILTGPTQKVG